MPPRKKKANTPATAESYKHADATSPMRPDVGTQAQFKKKKSPATYRYDSSLSPALDWDGQNPAREQAEALLAVIGAQLEKMAGKEADKMADKNVCPTEGAVGQTFLSALAKAEDALRQLKALGQPFLDWAGKAERLSFDVPTLPLFIHERLSTKGIIETLKGHKRQLTFDDLWGDPEHSISDQVMRAYEYPDKWSNRMMLGDSLVVMNSLLHYENLGGQVQMIYMDPPYGVKFGSNFQPFVRKRDVSHNDDEDFTREPEMVQAYRDTWELGLHSYLTYMRDRLLLARDLLHPSGSIFVQISDENLHHVRELMDEVFGAENFVSLVTFSKTTGATVNFLPSTCDYLLWYARDRERTKYRDFFLTKKVGAEGATNYNRVELPDGTRRALSASEKEDISSLPHGSRIYALDNLTSQSMGREKGEGAACWFPVVIDGKEYRPNMQSRWKTNEDGMAGLLAAKRLEATASRVGYVRYFEDFPVYPLSNEWSDVGASFMADKLYIVQTTTKVIQRCLLMTTDPGDLVLDPTCGSGTTAFVAEQWGRRWITTDVSRVPLALARQRLLTATFPWYELKDAERGPAGGFVYKRKQNQKGEEVGGIVPHVTLKSIANNEPPAEEVLVDRPEIVKAITRVSGAFTVEASMPTAMDLEADKNVCPTSVGQTFLSASERMLEILRKSPILRLPENKTVSFKNIRPPAKSLSLSAEAIVQSGADIPVCQSEGRLESLPHGSGRLESLPHGSGRLESLPHSVAFVFGPENGPISERLVYEAAREANAKSYTHLYVIGFAVEAKARQLIDTCADAVGVPATYVQATPDILMGDLLKNMRSSQIFSVCGLPDVHVEKIKAKSGADIPVCQSEGRLESLPHGSGRQESLPHGESDRYQVTLRGLDVFDPVTMENHPLDGNNVPAWFLDTDYNGLVFHVCQAFFPRTAAWDNLKKALKADFKESLWDHLAGTTSAPFEAGDKGEIAVKVIDDRGNELMVVKKL